ncbi:MAG: hypothetical protein FWC84_03060 [Alphaproteobacteria bacterium]|nr:hypothetical protein [Alphaproteobacteria bacterium]
MALLASADRQSFGELPLEQRSGAGRRQGTEFFPYLATGWLGGKGQTKGSDSAQNIAPRKYFSFRLNSKISVPRLQ